MCLLKGTPKPPLPEPAGNPPENAAPSVSRWLPRPQARPTAPLTQLTDQAQAEIKVRLRPRLSHRAEPDFACVGKYKSGN